MKPSAPSWSLWIDIARPGWANMAIDQTLLERAAAGERWLRLYGWNPFCLSFGRNEPATRRYDADRIERLGLDVVRRPTGGRAVWHGCELTYTVACPVELATLRESYLEIHRMLRDALRSLGVPAELAPSRRAAGVGAGACFAQPAGGEIMVEGRKVIGSAQLRENGALLQHGSILLGDDQRMVGAVTRGAVPTIWAHHCGRSSGRTSSRTSSSRPSPAPRQRDGRGRGPLSPPRTSSSRGRPGTCAALPLAGVDLECLMSARESLWAWWPCYWRPCRRARNHDRHRDRRTGDCTCAHANGRSRQQPRQCRDLEPPLSPPRQSRT